MAILTRERYEQQGKELFSAEYFGVYSDNEYSLRAFKDGVVRDSRHIHFKHQHPIFQGKPREEWDETHKRQNEQRRYDEGKAIFERRNAHLLTQ
jgi:GT2 family glycosyltransferase